MGRNVAALEPILSDESKETFLRDGFLHIDEVINSSLVDACRERMWEETGLSNKDVSNWTSPVVAFTARRRRSSRKR